MRYGIKLNLKQTPPNPIDEPDFYQNRSMLDNRIYAEYSLEEIRKYRRAFDTYKNDITYKRNNDILSILPCKCEYLKSLGGQNKCNVCIMTEKRNKA